ncbi:MAG: hypothetical protein H6R14_1200 [Proteobacteria bacterium]|nr:hypothetical protein [Pseudomonadota bacterium]
MSLGQSGVADGCYPCRAFWRKPLFLLCLGLVACSSWHWEKRGAQEGEYARDETFCKQLVYTGTDGFVTNASVRRMHDCMQAKGWQKVTN